ncbi:MAG: T9SS type B sorting domain-containing protein [Bacteroidetes bacterium]|nr:T9SS type B sorting domain-containing protein [Bacteroidota bacterium]
MLWKTLPFTALVCVCMFLNIVAFSNTMELSTGQTDFSVRKVRLLKKVIEKDLPQTIRASASSSPLSPLPCEGLSGEVGGTIFGDYNKNGLNDQIGAIEGITVYIFGCGAEGESMLLDSTFSDYAGEYSFSGLTDGASYRLEFVVPASLKDLNAGFGGGDNGTDVQFVTAPDCEADVGFSAPQDFCEPIPFMIATCFVNGDPLADGATGADMETVVMFANDSEGSTTPPQKLANAGEVGSVYGLAYDRGRQLIYTSAFIKRHVGLGPLGIGGIYTIDVSDPDNPLVAPFLDVKTIGIDVGDILSNSARGLPADSEMASNDPEAYDAVAKKGIGSIVLSDDLTTLWLVNLANQTLYSIEIDSDNNPATIPTNEDVTSYPLPETGCTNGSFRPFAVKYYRGNLYVGGVCDAAIGGTVDDLEAIIYKFSNGVFSKVFRFDLDYVKGYTTSTDNCENYPGWYPWISDLPPSCSTDEVFRVYPMPVLSDIEIDVDGSMILGFMDRLGHQIGYKNYPLNGVLPLLQTISGGDLIRVHNNNGVFELENNGTAGPHATTGAGSNQGPGGGEFYFQDIFEGPLDNVTPDSHTETSQGGLAFFPGSGEIATTALNPYSTHYNTGGVNWFSNTTGEVRVEGYSLYLTVSSSISTFEKANGLGDIHMICSEAPLELGSYIWSDDNSNGVQDPCEGPLSGINVSLFSEDGILLTTVLTDANGQYYFNENTLGLETILPNTTYHIVVGTGNQFNPATRKLNDALFLTTPDTGTGPNPEKNDSDGQLATENIAGGAFTGMPYFTLTSEGDGFVDHSFDIGFSHENHSPTGSVNGRVWNDVNKNGIIDTGELGLEGVTVQIFQSNGTFISTALSDSDGKYTVPGILAGDYYLEYDPYTNSEGISDFEFTTPNANGGIIDSDADPLTGQTPVFTFDPANGNLNDLNAGFIIPPGNVVGFVWNDVNENGIIDTGEPGLQGVTVHIYEQAGTLFMTVQSGAYGFYDFPDIPTGDYYLEFNPFTNSEGITDFEFTSPNANGGIDDSDADPLTGQTPVFYFDPANGDLDVNAGFIEPSEGTINGLVFFDCNKNGIHENGEEGMSYIFIVLSGNDETGATVNIQTNSDVNGQYAFNDISAGTYSLQFDIPINSGLAFSPKNQGDDDNVDSDVNGNGTTIAFANLDSESIVLDAGIMDVEAPIFVNPPDDIAADCTDPEIFNPPVLTAIDNMDTDVEITFSESSGTTNGICEEGNTIIRTWTATDDCGHVTVETQTVTKIDNVAPEIIFTHPDLVGTQNGDTIYVDCSAELPYSLDDAYGVDACGSEVNMKFFNWVDEVGSCSVDEFIRVMICTWTAEDGCGNYAEIALTMIIVDTQPPVIIGVPADVTIDCQGYVPFSTVTAEDQCTEEPIIQFEEEVIGDPCSDHARIRRWTAIDDCNNIINEEQVITIKVNELGITGVPELYWTETPEGVVLNCGDELPPVIEPVLSRYCFNTLITMEIIIVGDTCSTHNIIRKWTATNDCDNSISATQVISIVDTTPPEIFPLDPFLSGISNGDTLFVDCMSVPLMNEYAVEAIDNCNEDVFVEFVENNSSPEDCAESGYTAKMVYGWRADDLCGNIAEWSVTILVVDELPPAIHNVPNDITIDLSIGDVIPDVTSDVFATDNCDDNIEIIYGENIEAQEGGCGYILIRKWKAQDDCGNTASEEQHIYVNDFCDCPDIIVEYLLVQNATCENESGRMEVKIAGNPQLYNYTLVPDAGVSNEFGNIIEDLPTGSYLILISLSGMEDCIEKVYFDIGGYGCSQTISATIADTLTVLCIDETAFEIEGGITNTQICYEGNPSSVVITTVEENCVSLLPATGYEGAIPAPLCVIHCFDNGVCDTTYLDIAVEPLVSPCELSLSEIILHPSCEGNDGEIILYVGGMAGDLVFNWEPAISSTAYAPGLSNGTYFVSVTDSETDCEVSGSFSLESGSMPEISASDVTITHLDCPDNNNGSIVSNTNKSYSIYSGGFIIGMTPKYNLGVGIYTVVNDDGTCADSIQVEITSPPNWTVVVSGKPETCEGNDGTIALLVFGANGNYNYEWSTVNDSGSTAFGLSAELSYFVTITDEVGCSFVVSDLSVDYECNADCNAEAGFLSSTSLFTFCVDDGEADYIHVLAEESIGNYIYLLTNTDSTIIAISTIASFNVEGTDQDTLFIRGLAYVGELNGIQQGQSISEISGCFDLSYPLTITTKRGEDCTEIINEICDNGIDDDDDGLADCFDPDCSCPVDCPDIVTMETAVLHSDDCDQGASLCIDILLQDVGNYIVKVNDDFYTQPFLGCNFDTMLAYSYYAVPNQGGLGTYQLNAWSINGKDHQTIFNTMSDLVDSMNVWDSTGSWMLNEATVSIVGGNPLSDYSSMTIIQLATNSIAVLELNSNLVPYGFEMQLSTGQHQIIITEILSGCQDTMKVLAGCTPDIHSEILTETMFPGDTETVCSASEELPGNVISVELLCEDDECESADFFLNEDNCAVISALSPGIDTASLIVCDDMGFCDTTILVVTVEEIVETIMPKAGIDADTTLHNTNLIIDVLANDYLNGDMVGMSISDPPVYGEVIINPDHSITYLPMNGYCGTDAFAYEICNETGCVAAPVHIKIECKEPVPFTGISPNNDGINDLFVIHGIEQYPDNELSVFNRWGHLIYREEGYRNEWGATFKDEILPDGTYFYLLKDGLGNIYSGYIHLHR